MLRLNCGRESVFFSLPVLLVGAECGFPRRMLLWCLPRVSPRWNNRTDISGFSPIGRNGSSGFPHKVDRFPVPQVWRGFPLLDCTRYIDNFLPCRGVQDLDPVLPCGNCPAFVLPMMGGKDG